MRRFFTRVVNNPRKIIVLFLAAALVCAVLQSFVAVDYDMKDYLPEDSPSTIALDKMNDEFDGGIPNARVMVKDVSIPEALAYKEKLKSCAGVTDVLWLDDAADIYQPVETMDAETVETYYKDGAALFTVTIDEDARIEAVAAIRAVIGEDNAMTGDAVSTAIATTGTISEIHLITALAVAVVLLVLLITTPSWIEPLIVLTGLGVAIMINNGSNLIFGEISFVTNAAGAVLQLAVSLDYSVFLIHRYEECLGGNPDRRGAMVDALCRSTSSILASGLTTVIGFLALLFMRFGIGPDLGLALAKGIGISLLVVFVFMPALILELYPLMEKTRHKRLLPEFTGFGRLVSGVMIPMVLIFAVLLVPSFLASNQNAYYYGSSYIYGSNTQLGRDTQEIEDIFGKSDTYVVLIPNGDAAAEIKLSGALHDIPEVKSVISYADTVGAEVPKEYLDKDTLSQLVGADCSRMVLTVETDHEGEATFSLIETLRDTVGTYYPDAYYLAGEGISTYDLMDTITADTLKVNLIAIAAVFVVLLLTMRSISLPVILVLAIETAIWINMAIPYFTGSVVFYIAYLIISSVQLGATVDYAILFTDRYMEFRRSMGRREAVTRTVSAVTVSVLTSGTVMAGVGFLLGKISTHGILSQLGLFLGKGTILSTAIVLFVLPGLLYLLDKPIGRTTLNADFYKSKRRKIR
ncbi:MAG: MMPL family transporter [Oscillospiraceae bacterium]|nr:MMPL family transporter [Oscillospiraceae bacterium]